MNILYVGPYRQNDGWGEASRNLVLALAQSKNECAIRPIYMGGNPQRGELPNPFSSLETRKLPSYDAIIQHMLPNLFEYDARFGKNIGMFFSETAHLEYTGWVYKCNLMDEIWVSSEQEKKNLIQSGVTVPIKKIHVPVEVSKYERSYNKLLMPQFGKEFVFYTIGEYTQRKNMHAAMIAFHLEFAPHEPVNLVIKTNRIDMHPQQLHQTVMKDIESLKQSFRIYESVGAYKQETVITDYLPEEMLLGLHSSADCFIMPSHGEAWCIPAMDALGFGKTPIVCSHTGTEEFINDQNGWVVPSHEAPVLAADPPIPFLYTAKETWRNINILELRKAMREAFENQIVYKAKSKAGTEHVYKYTFEKVAEQINEST